MNDTLDSAVEETRQTLEDHLTTALDHAEDETARFHLRHARQIAVDLPTVIEKHEDA